MLRANYNLMFLSRALSSQERKYCTREKEALAIKWAIKRLHHYLWVPFEVITDHKSLKWLMETEELESRLGRWALRLAAYNFTITWREGSKNAGADALSRCYLVEACECTYHAAAELSQLMSPQLDGERVATITVEPPTLEQKARLDDVRVEDPLEPEQPEEQWSALGSIEFWKDSYYEDPEIGQYVRWLSDRKKHKPRSAEEERKFELWNQTSRIEDKLLKKWNPSNPERKWIWVPVGLQRRLLAFYHRSNMAGHIGRDKMDKLLRRSFYWKGMSNSVKNYISHCNECARVKNPHPSRYGLQDSELIDPEIFSTIYIDHVGPFPLTRNGNLYILTMYDGLTSWMEAEPVPDQKATTTAAVIFSKICCRYGIPKVIRCDNHKGFSGDIIKQLCNLIGIKMKFTSPYNPRANWVEREHRTLGQCIKTYALSMDIQNTWDEHLDAFLAASRSTVRLGNGYTPSFMLYGQEMRTAPERILEGDEETLADIDDWLVTKVRAMKAAAKLMIARRESLKQKRNAEENERRITEPFREGDLVYIYSQAGRPRGTSSKLYAKYNGPYQVLTRMGVSSYKVRGVATGVEMTVVGSNMIPARDYYASRKAEEPESHPADLEDKESVEVPADSKESTGDPPAEEASAPPGEPLASTDTKRSESLGQISAANRARQAGLKVLDDRHSVTVGDMVLFRLDADGKIYLGEVMEGDELEVQLWRSDNKGRQASFSRVWEDSLDRTNPNIEILGVEHKDGYVRVTYILQEHHILVSGFKLEEKRAIPTDVWDFVLAYFAEEPQSAYENVKVSRRQAGYKGKAKKRKAVAKGRGRARQ